MIRFERADELKWGSVVPVTLQSTPRRAAKKRSLKSLALRTPLASATRPRAPQANAICERLVGTLRRDCLDHLLVFGERHTERVLREYVRYYHARPHRSLRAQPPAGARWLAPARAATSRDVTAIPVLGGLHHRYGFPSAGPSPPP
jgi:transposase InsO family protein